MFISGRLVAVLHARLRLSMERQTSCHLNLLRNAGQESDVELMYIISLPMRRAQAPLVTALQACRKQRQTSYSQPALFRASISIEVGR